MPTFLSMYQGGISRATTFCLIDLAHGRASSYVSNGMGANVSGRWQTWQCCWRMGATSLVNVTCPWALEASATNVMMKVPLILIGPPPGLRCPEHLRC